MKRLTYTTRCLLTYIFIYSGLAVTSVIAAPPQEPAPPTTATLEVQMGVPFLDNAVLQQKIPLPVWGASLDGAKVTLNFKGQVKTATADKDGKWKVVFEPMTAVKLKTVNDSPEGESMTITCEKDGTKTVKEIKNLILGDVWFCAGQSNMAGAIRTKKISHYPEDTLEKATYPALRQFQSGDNAWVVCAPDTAPVFKKVAFFFARRLQQDALVPIGLIATAVGGSNIESWLNQEPYKTGGNYTQLVAPLVGYGIRGAIWYQGESNEADRRNYQPKLESLITGWRKAWNQGDFPVHFVQLPGIGTSPLDNPAGGDGRAEIRQAYVEALALKNTGMAVTIDVGAPGEHPPNKYDTGDRLARSVLQKVYGFKDLTACPLYKKHATEGNAIRITFDNAKNGLMVAKKEGFPPPVPTPDVKPQWLSIQAKDGTWHWADGVIDGSELIVSCKDVKDPIAVRYAYTQQPVGNILYNKEGQPVGPFSTIGYGPEQPADSTTKPKK
ncbi:MAG: sialate O-acetylesterase [Verrucomicrobiota bacterium]